MSSPQRRVWDPSSGAFGRLTSAAYRLLMVELCLVLASSPGLVGILLLDRHPSNIPLYALCAVPVGPALSGALFALRRTGGERELEPWRMFWRGWWMNLGQVLAVWVPALAFAAISGFNLAFSTGDDVVELFVIAGAILGVVVIVWATATVVVVSVFRFRTVDAARITIYALGIRPLVPLGVLSLLVLATAIVAFTSDLVLVALAVLFALALGTTTRPLVRVIEERFVAP